MKKTMILAAFAALISLSSCQKEEVIDNGTDKSASSVFTASIAGATKTTIDLTEGKVAWEESDEITVTDASSASAVYTIESIDATTGKATFAIKDGENALGAGPYTAKYGTEPATAQTYSAAAGKLYMTAPATSNNSFTFTVQCGLMKLNLTKSGESVKSIAVTGTPTDGSETTYTLTCTESQSIATAKDFFIALPAGNYKKIEITNASDKKCTLNSASGVVVAANHIKPVTFGESKIEFVTSSMVNSVAEANVALKTHNAVSIENPSDAESNDIVIPSEQDGKDVYITVNGTPEKSISIKNEDGGTGAAKLTIESDSKNLTINTPQTHVDLYKGNFETVTATTSATTLVVGKDVKIEHLDITKGNVEIHGKVTSLTRENGVKAKMYASDRATLINYINWTKADDVAGLECDINLAGEDWTPLRVTDFFAATFDGQGHTISNLKVMDYTGAYIGFISVISGATIKNVTFKDATLTNAVSNEGGRGAVIAGWSYACVIDNCHVINSSVTGGQKVAGILGTISVEGASSLNKVTNCSVENLTLSSNISGEKIYQSGALVGYIQLIAKNPNGVILENNSVKNITINDDCGDNGNVGYYNGPFIGTIVRKQQIDGQKIILNNNTVSGTNTELFKTIYSSPYFGWTTNAENYKDAIAPIVIDGQEWTPDYPAQIAETGVKYPLDKALAAATSGQTVRILKAGDYTVQTLSTNATVVEATVNGVVFNRTTAGGWVAAQTENVKTVKNITWNVGNGSYQYFSNTNLENCTVNGILFTHMTNKFKDCTFINEEGYNFWVYGNVYTEFDNCTFTCPGKNKDVAGCGGAINCYNEGDQQRASVLVVKNCTFTAKEASNKYSALYIKPETAFDILISNTTCNDKFFTGAISGSKLWNLTSDREGTTVSIDGNMVYPFCSKDADGNYHIINAAGLLQFHDLYADGK